MENWSAVFKKINDDFPDIWLFIYAQPNGNASKKDVLKRVDIAGSKSITQRCEYFVSLNREKVRETNEDEDRSIFVYLDKGRTQTRSHIGTWIYFDVTGNFRNKHEKKFNEWYK